MATVQASSKCLYMSICFLILMLLPVIVSGECTCDADEEEAGKSQKEKAIRYKIVSIASVLVAGAIGVSLPLMSRKIPSLNPESDVFFMVKAFAAGVILGTGFMHILPEAFQTLTSPCLKESPWGKFPFTGFISMLASIGTLLVDSLATGYYKRQHVNKSKQVAVDGHIDEEHAGHVHVHAHVPSYSSEGTPESELIRHRVISQVLELGIVVHSVIIGISLGATQRSETIRPLILALSFHQFFEGMGLGSCISQAKFKSRSTAIMATFFSLTTPIGIAIGIGMASVYKENSPTALIVEGIFNSASAGILIYMALVDLLAADFMDSKLQSNIRLQVGAIISLLSGAGCMSVVAMWT